MSPLGRPRRRVSTRRPMAAAVAVSVVTLMAACGLSGQDAGDGSSSDGPIVIGMSLPLSGPVADRAKPGMEGYQYWVDELNANGGLLGREVELKVLDDGFDQQTAISDYNRLISQDKVDLLLGTFSSDLNVAVAPIAERFQIRLRRSRPAEPTRSSSAGSSTCSSPSRLPRSGCPTSSST